MSLRDLLRFWCFDRAATLRLAADPRSLGVGAVFVLVAALARDYDAEYLLARPWHLGLSFVASTVSATLLFVLCLAAARRSLGGGFRAWDDYRRFLALFWLTGPLAWIYAVPVERFLDPLGAAQANLTLLGIVAAWRVLLAIRIVSALFGGRGWRPAALVLGFASCIAFVALLQRVANVVVVMGGMTLSPERAWVQRVTLNLGIVVLYGGPVAAIAALVALVHPGGAWSPPTLPEPERPPRSLAPSLALAGIVALALCTGAVRAQSEQAHRDAVERAFRAGDVDEALRLLAAAQDAFPPHWLPPPTPFADGLALEHPSDVLVRLVAHPETPTWVRDHYLRVLPDEVHWELVRARGIDAARVNALVAALGRLTPAQRLPFVVRGYEPLSDLLDGRDETLRDGLDFAALRALLSEPSPPRTR